MDVALYLSELLGQQGEVNVPGLGHFVQLRLDGYYNKEEAVFYPPSHKVDFKSDFVDDDSLAQYISEQRNISLASSKYFTEKYITGLKEEASQTDVAIGDLGWLHIAGTDVTFKAADALDNVPEFFGFPQIKLEKLNTVETETPIEAYIPPVIETHTEPEPLVETITDVVPEPVTEEPETEEPQSFADAIAYAADQEPQTYQVYEPAAETPVEEPPVIAEDKVVEEPAIIPQETKATPVVAPVDDDFVLNRYSDEGTSRLASRTLWVVLALILVAGAGIFAFYLYNPVQFSKILGVNQPKKYTTDTTTKEYTPIAQSVAGDSAKDSAKTTQPAAKKDTVLKTTTSTPAPAATAATVPASTIDSAKTRYEIIGSSFKTEKTAEVSIKNYKSIGIDAHTVTWPGSGRLIKLSLGTYDNEMDAWKARNALIKSRKVTKDIYIQKVNPKQ